MTDPSHNQFCVDQSAKKQADGYRVQRQSICQLFAGKSIGIFQSFQAFKETTAMQGMCYAQHSSHYIDRNLTGR
jgi:hypothetical protein